MTFAPQVFMGCLVILIFFGLWKVLQPRPAFKIKLVSGRGEDVMGTATPALMDLVVDVARHNHVESGWVAGIPSGNRIRLIFSKSFPQPAQQQIRNGWGILRWKPPGASPSPFRRAN